MNKKEINHRLREFLVASIRSGIIKIKRFNITLLPPSLDDIIESYYVYEKSFNDALQDGLMTSDSIDEWMLRSGLWTNLDDEDLKKMRDKIDDLKLELYKNYSNIQLVKAKRKSLRNLELKYQNSLSVKNTYYSRSCESHAEATRLMFLMRLCCKDQIANLDDNLEFLIQEYHNCIIDENTIRFLARSEPWRSLWSVSSSCGLKLFSNEEPTINQKNIVLWSKTYDGVHESTDCPPKEVIEDDDFLDGWFIHQNRKRESEKKENDFESKTTNPKIKSASEVFIFANDKEQAKSIHSMNSEKSKEIIKRRQSELVSHGKLAYHDMPDQKELLKKQLREKGMKK